MCLCIFSWQGSWATKEKQYTMLGKLDCLDISLLLDLVEIPLKLRIWFASTIQHCTLYPAAPVPLLSILVHQHYMHNQCPNTLPYWRHTACIFLTKSDHPNTNVSVPTPTCIPQETCNRIGKVRESSFFGIVESICCAVEMTEMPLRSKSKSLSAHPII